MKEGRKDGWRGEESLEGKEGKDDYKHGKFWREELADRLGKREERGRNGVEGREDKEIKDDERK